MEKPFKEPTVKELLMKFLNKCDITWNEYQRHNEEVTRELAREGFIVDERGIENLIPKTGRLWGHYIKTIMNFDPRNQIILVSSDLFPDFHHQRVSKKGNLLHVPRRGRLDVQSSLIERIKKIEAKDLFVGMDWQGRHKTTQEYRIVQLNDIFRAHKMLKHLKDKKIELPFKIYPGNPLTRGVTAVVHSVPSLSSRAVYTVKLFHIAAYDKPEDREKVINISYDLKDKHSCGKSDWYVVKDSRGNAKSIFAHEREGDEIILDQHVILAFEYLKPHLRDLGFKVIDPFLHPNKIKKGWILSNRLQYVLKETRHNDKVKRAHLDNLEREISFGKLLDYNNFCWEQEVSKGRRK